MSFLQKEKKKILVLFLCFAKKKQLDTIGYYLKSGPPKRDRDSFNKR